MGFCRQRRQKFHREETLCRSTMAARNTACGWAAWGPTDPAGRETVLALGRVLRHAGVTFGVPRKREMHRRRGAPFGQRPGVHATGGSQHRKRCRAAKVGKMVSICPHCVRTIGTDWREAGATFQIEHHSELLARLKDRLPGRGGIGGAGDRGVPRPVLPGPIPRTNTTSRGRWSRGPRPWWRPAARASARSVAGRRAAEMFLGEEKGTRREHRARRGTGGDGRTGHRHGPVRSARRCSAMRWGQSPRRRRNCWTIAQIVAASLPPEQSVASE